MIQRSIQKSFRIFSPSLRACTAPLPIHRLSPSLQAQNIRWRGQIMASRSYAATAIHDQENGGDAVAAAAALETSQTTESKAEEPLQKELETKNREIIDLKDKYLRSVAEFRNLQDRTRREVQSARDFAISRFAKDLVESIDNLDRALGTVPAERLQPPSSETSEAEPSVKDLINLYDGLKMTETILMQTLKKHGLERFDPSETGEKFDPNLHEATFMTPQEGKEDGVVFHTQQKGFLLNGRVIRAAKVGIVKNT